VNERNITLCNADGLMNSTLAGTTTECNGETSKTEDSMHFNDDGRSNEIDSRDRQKRKRREQRTLI
jgi:hypothetical protein